MSDPRECGWMGCGHPECAERCAGVALARWLTECWGCGHDHACADHLCADCRSGDA